MKLLFMKFTIIDVIAIITIVGGIIMKCYGADGTVSLLLTTIVFYYFGKKGAEIEKCMNEQKQNDKL